MVHTCIGPVAGRGPRTEHTVNYRTQIFWLVTHVTGLSETAYHNVRKSLSTLIQNSNIVLQSRIISFTCIPVYDHDFQIITFQFLTEINVDG